MPLITKEEMYLHEFTIGFECNKCKKVVSSEDQPEDYFLELQEMFHYRFEGGYGSVFGDGYRFEIVLCQDCKYEILSPYAEDITERHEE